MVEPVWNATPTVPTWEAVSTVSTTIPVGNVITDSNFSLEYVLTAPSPTVSAVD